MTDLNHVAELLRAKRTELLKALDGVDKALAALVEVSASSPETADPASVELTDAPPNAVVSTVVKPKRMLSDSHKQALSMGQRRARGAKDAAKGLAREMPEASFVPAIGTRGQNQAPRLVKRGTSGEPIEH